MELALSVWQFEKIIPKDFQLITVPNGSAQKEKGDKKGETLQDKKYCFKKAAQHKPCFSPPSTSPSFSKAHCSAMRFLKSPTLATYAASWSQWNKTV